MPHFANNEMKIGTWRIKCWRFCYDINVNFYSLLLHKIGTSFTFQLLRLPARYVLGQCVQHCGIILRFKQFFFSLCCAKEIEADEQTVVIQDVGNCYCCRNVRFFAYTEVIILLYIARIHCKLKSIK